MPYVNPGGGSSYNPEWMAPAPAPVVSYSSVVQGAASNQNAVATQAVAVEDAVADTSVSVKALPKPVYSPADLPTNAEPGQIFHSVGSPGAIFFFCSDYLWRALALAPAN